MRYLVQLVKFTQIEILWFLWCFGLFWYDGPLFNSWTSWWPHIRYPWNRWPTFLLDMFIDAINRVLNYAPLLPSPLSLTLTLSLHKLATSWFPLPLNSSIFLRILIFAEQNHVNHLKFLAIFRTRLNRKIKIRSELHFIHLHELQSLL